MSEGKTGLRRAGRWLISERLVISVILLNTTVLTLGGFFAEGSPQRSLLDAIDYACVSYFLLEALLKIGIFGWRGYWSLGWNRFDFLILLFCIPVLLKPFLELAGSLGLAPVLRTGRLFRLFRLLRFIPHIDSLVGGIRRALRASIGVFLGLMLMALIFALAANVLFAERAPESFGNPAQAFYSVFQIFTLEGWNEFPEFLGTGQGRGWLFVVRAFFMFTVLIGGILGISLANAVFVDEMTMDNTRLLEAKVDDLMAEVQALKKLLEQSPDRGAP